MASTFWIKDSKFVLDGSSKASLCATCPCTASCDDVRDAIRERQNAVDITTAWSAGDPTNVDREIATCAEKASYTLTELKAYVNNFATSYLDGTYTGGASAPTMLTGTYANSASDEQGIYDLVVDMLSTKPGTAAQYGHDGYQYSGTDTSTVSRGDAESNAQSNYADAGANANLPAAWTHTDESSNYYCLLEVIGAKWKVESLHTGINKTIRFFGYFAKDVLGYQFNVYDDQGQTGVGTEDQFTQLESVAGGANATVNTSSRYPDPTSMPDNIQWTGGGAKKVGFHVYCSWGVADWSFTHT